MRKQQLKLKLARSRKIRSKLRLSYKGAWVKHWRNILSAFHKKKATSLALVDINSGIYKWFITSKYMEDQVTEIIRFHKWNIQQRKRKLKANELRQQEIISKNVLLLCIGLYFGRKIAILALVSIVRLTKPSVLRFLFSSLPNQWWGRTSGHLKTNMYNRFLLEKKLV